MVLPEAFWGSKDGFRGGVETGLMSTTTDRSVAMQYSGSRDGKRCTVFEILAGRVDIGADLSWVSQYPGEREVPLPASSYTCICLCSEREVRLLAPTCARASEVRAGILRADPVPAAELPRGD